MLRRCSVLILLTLVTVSAASAQKMKEITAIITSARFVFVTTEAGDPYSTPVDSTVSGNDREAVADVQDELQKWGRYQLVYSADQADIIIAVRRGRIAQPFGGVRIGNRGKGPMTGGEIGPANDMMSVYMKTSYPDAPPLWRMESKGGLVHTGLPIFQEFKKQVEQAPAPQSKQKP